jgi:hypothetical protein
MPLETAPKREIEKPQTPATDSKGRKFVPIEEVQRLQDSNQVIREFTCAEGKGSLTDPATLRQKFPNASKEELATMESNYGNRLTRVVLSDGRILYSRFNDTQTSKEKEPSETEKEQAINEGIREVIGMEVPQEKIDRVKNSLFNDPRLKRAVTLATLFIISAYAAMSLNSTEPSKNPEPVKPTPVITQAVTPGTSFDHITTIRAEPKIQGSEIGKEVPDRPKIVMQGGVANWKTLDTLDDYKKLYGTTLKATIEDGVYTISSEDPNLNPREINQSRGIDFNIVAVLKPLDNPNFDPEGEDWEGARYLELPKTYDEKGRLVIDIKKLTPAQLSLIKQYGSQIMWQGRVGDKFVKSGVTPVESIFGENNNG